MREKSTKAVMLISATLLLTACGGGTSNPSVTIPYVNNGTISSSGIPLSPIASVQATGSASFANPPAPTTSYPALSASMSGYLGASADLTAPTVDLTGTDMQFAIASTEASVALQYGGTTYNDVFYNGNAFRFDPYFAVEELQVTGLNSAYSDLLYYAPYSTADALQYTEFGFWSRDIADDSATTIIAPYVFGYVTPAGAMPSTGTANYTGRMIGVGASTGADGAYFVTGTFSGTADFAALTISTYFSNLTAINTVTNASAIFSNFGGTANISGNSFAGSIASTATSGTVLAGTNTLTGSVNGEFFGPAAQEVGGVWTLTGGTWNASGSFGGK